MRINVRILKTLKGMPHEEKDKKMWVIALGGPNTDTRIHMLLAKKVLGGTYDPELDALVTGHSEPDAVQSFQEIFRDSEYHSLLQEASQYVWASWTLERRVHYSKHHLNQDCIWSLYELLTLISDGILGEGYKEHYVDIIDAYFEDLTS